MFNNHKSYNRMYREGELTLGLHIPLENFKMRTPTLESQVELAQKADDYGFTALWLRDVLLKDPNFLDSGSTIRLAAICLKSRSASWSRRSTITIRPLIHRTVRSTRRRSCRVRKNASRR